MLFGQTSSHLLAGHSEKRPIISGEDRDATKLALDKPLWKLLAVSRALFGLSTFGIKFSRPPTKFIINSYALVESSTNHTSLIQQHHTISPTTPLT